MAEEEKPSKKLSFHSSGDFDLRSSGDFNLRSAGNCIVKLGDAGGEDKFRIYDSNNVEVFAVDSSGAINMNETNILNVGTVQCDTIAVDDSSVGLDVQFGGATTLNKITLTDNLADALNINQGGNSYIKFVTTDSSEQIVFGQNATFASQTIADLGTVTTADINGGTMDGVTIGGASAAAGTFTTLSASSLGSALDANDQAITNINVDSGAIDGSVIGANSAAAGTFTSIVGTSLSLSDGNLTNVGSVACDSIVVDDSSVGLDVQFGGDTTLNKITLTDNLADALNINQGGNSYIKFVTTNSSEQIVFGQNTTFNGTTIADLGTVTTADINGGTMDGVTIGGASAAAGTFTTLSASSLGSALDANDQAITNINVDSGAIDGSVIGANSAAAGTFTSIVGTSLSLSDGNLTNVGSVACDSIVVDDSSVGLDVQFGGATTLNKITLTDNLADALNINQGGNSYIKFVTTDSSEQIVFGQNATFASQTIADLGTVTTADINGGTMDGVTIGGASAAAGTFTTLSASSLGSALDANDQAITNINVDSGAIDGSVIGANSAAAGTFTSIVGTSLSLSDGNLTNVGSVACDSIVVDDSSVGLDVQFGGDTTLNKITLTDNLADALNINQGGNSYIKFVTTNSSEQIVFGQNTTFNGTTIADLGTVTTADINGGTMDGVTIGGASAAAGTFTTLSASSLGSALDANDQAITNINVDSGAIDGSVIGANSAAAGTFTTLTANSVQMVDNTISAFTIKEGTNDYIDFITTNNAEKIIFHKGSNFTDSTVLDFGNDNDLIIEHNGTNSTMTSKTGNLVIDNTNASGATIIQLGSDNANSDFQVKNNSEQTLFEVNGAGTASFPNTDINVSGENKQFGKQGKMTVRRIPLYQETLGTEGNTWGYMHDTDGATISLDTIAQGSSTTGKSAFCSGYIQACAVSGVATASYDLKFALHLTGSGGGKLSDSESIYVNILQEDTEISTYDISVTVADNDIKVIVSGADSLPATWMGYLDVMEMHTGA